MEKEFFWFEENLNQVLEARQSQSFWQDNTLFLEKDQKITISEVLRKIDTLGYEKVFKLSQPGEFSHLGGIIDVFPINQKQAIRIDFLGNKIETIEELPLQVENEELSKKLLKKKLKSQQLFSDVKNLKTGDYLVHLDHGIARFAEKCQQDDKEYYVLEYGGEDKLYVPVGLERKLSRYIGFRDPKLSRLSSGLWQRTKHRIKEEAEKLAKELLAMFAQKEICQRPAYPQKEMAEKLSATFPHSLTPDQIDVLKDIAKDLAKAKPMDRVVCGDVGFGKTEIALRASAMVAENGKQVAIIAPTTILAQQHYQTFKKRLADLPFKVASLSRLSPKKEQKITLEGIKTGAVDILIGTHSLLAKKAVFKNLGLLIIDDEQKFGVKQKEKLRTLNPSIDVLYLSATPIPRTLYMALSSLKNISFIQTPPQGRKAVKTFVLPFKKEIIKKAINHELERNGQIYFLHNRIETINAFKHFLESLQTKAKIGILHAKLPEQELVRTLNDFQNKKFDLLLATTIIENGIDLPNVNTLIVDNATKLGLSQSYQLRGRIGRSDIQGYSYFMYAKQGLKGLAKKRLKALEEAAELGSGYRIALADMEIRGAGNILGKEQSGSVNKVGLNLYCQMLAEAVEKLRGSE